MSHVVPVRQEEDVGENAYEEERRLLLEGYGVWRVCSDSNRNCYDDQRFSFAHFRVYFCQGSANLSFES